MGALIVGLLHLPCWFMYKLKNKKSNEERSRIIKNMHI